MRVTLSCRRPEDADHFVPEFMRKMVKHLPKVMFGTAIAGGVRGAGILINWRDAEWHQVLPAA
jgi:hypothetical protein